jgi:hypothetical protein
MPEILKARRVRIKEPPWDFARLTYTNETTEEFEIIRGSMAWPHGGIPGVILIGGVPRGGVDTIKVLEEAPFQTLPEARKILDDYEAKYVKVLPYAYYQNTPESEGFVKYLKSGGYSDPHLESAPYTESVDYSIQLVNSYVADMKLKVPGEGVLATQLQAGRDATANESDLHGVIALACLISGIQSRFEEWAGEFSFEDYPPEYEEC